MPPLAALLQQTAVEFRRDAPGHTVLVEWLVRTALLRRGPRSRRSRAERFAGFCKLVEDPQDKKLFTVFDTSSVFPWKPMESRRDFIVASDKRNSSATRDNILLHVCSSRIPAFERPLPRF